MHVPVGQPDAQGFINSGMVVSPVALNARIDQRYVERPPAFLMPEYLTPEKLEEKYSTVTDVNSRFHILTGKSDSSIDFTALQSAVNSSVTSGVPLLLRGVFNLTGGSITATGQIHINARNATFNQLDSLRPTFILPSNSSITGGQINGKGTDWVNTSSIYAAAGITIANGAENITIREVAITNMSGAGVDARIAGKGLKILHCNFSGVGSSTIPASTGQYGGGLVANNLTGFDIIGGNFKDFAQGIVMGQADKFFIGGGLELSAAGQHGIYLGNTKTGTISGVRVIDVPLQGIKAQISDSTPADSDLFTIGDATIYRPGSHAILLTNTQASPTGKHRRISVHDVMVDHGTALGDTLNLQHIAGATIHDIQGIGGNVGLRSTAGSRLDVHHCHFRNTQRSGVRSIDTTDSSFSNIRITDGATLADVADKFGFYISGATSARLQFHNNTIEDANAKMQYAFYLAAGELASMALTGNTSTGVDYGYRAHASTITQMWLANDLKGNIGRFFNVPPNAANVTDTSGATLTALETEVNKIKARLRDFKAYNA